MFCACCLTYFSRNKTAGVLPCGHSFHLICIDSFYKQWCPLCYKLFSKKDIKPLILINVEYVHGLIMRAESELDPTEHPIVIPEAQIRVVVRRMPPKTTESADGNASGEQKTPPSDEQSRQRKLEPRTPLISAGRRSRSLSNSITSGAFGGQEKSASDEKSCQREPRPRETSITAERHARSLSHSIESAIGGHQRMSSDERSHQRKSNPRRPPNRVQAVPIIRTLVCIICQNEFPIQLAANMPRMRAFVCSKECATKDADDEEE